MYSFSVFINQITMIMKFQITLFIREFLLEILSGLHYRFIGQFFWFVTCKYIRLVSSI